MKRLIANLLHIVVWVSVFVLLVFGFNRWHHNNQGGIVYETTSSIEDTIVLQSGRDHHYRLNGWVNDVKVHFLVDTGASKVALPESIAKKAGLKKQYAVSIRTASGLTRGYLTRIKTLKIGAIKLKNISALIMSQKTDEVLLGMSALKRLSLKQENGTLYLTKMKRK